MSQLCLTAEVLFIRISLSDSFEIGNRIGINRALRSATSLLESLMLILVAFEHILMMFWRDRLLVVPILVHELELLILTGLVDIDDMLLSFRHNNFSDILHVSALGAFLDLNSNLWVLYEDVVIQELLRYRNSFNIFFSQVNEFRFLVKADVVVTDVRVVVADDSLLDLRL